MPDRKSAVVSESVIDEILQYGLHFFKQDNASQNTEQNKTGRNDTILLFVFTDKAKLKKLNDIMFPYIIRNIEEKIQLKKEAEEGIIVLDAPTLFESGCDKFCDKVVSVIATEEVRCGRIIARDGLSEDEAMHRIRAQHSDSFYMERSWTVLQNNGDKEDLQMQAENLISRLEYSMEHPEETTEVEE